MKGIKRYFNKFPRFKAFLIIVIERLNNLKIIIFGLLIRGPFYLINLFRSTVIAGPTTMGYKGGVWNPGAIICDNNIILLAKGHYVSWWDARGRKKDYYLKGNPLIFLLDINDISKVKSIVVERLIDFPEKTALGDTRLFLFNNRIIINHSLVFLKENDTGFYQSKVNSSWSLLDLKGESITYLGHPQLDFDIKNIEKNWVYISQNNELYLFYSLNPFRVLRLVDESNLQFETILNKQFNNGLKDPGGFGTMVSLSVNPIVYDDDYWLIIIHQIHYKISGRCYHHWAVLIDRLSLIPKKITSKPIFSGIGARGRTPGIRYISSIIKMDNEILFFAGEGDIYTTMMKKEIKELDSLFVKL